MKKLVIFFALVLFFTSCNENEVVPKKSDAELTTLTLEKVAANETVLNDVFSETSSTITRAAIQNALSTSSTKAAFITNMNALVERTFEDQVKSNSEQLAADMFIKFDGVKGESVKNTVQQFILEANAADPLISYSNKVKSLIDAQRASGRSLLVLIQKVEDGTTSQAAPSEQMSLNFEKIAVMHEMQHRIITAATTGISAETDTEIDDIFAQQGVPPVAIGLLLPAVMKVQSSQNATLPYWDWLFNDINPEINGGLNRDIIRRYNAAGFMGAIQLLLSDEYMNDNQDLASMLLLRARYQASLMFIFNDIWEKSKLAKLMQERVKSNERILENAFIETAKLVTRAAILNARAASADKAAFMGNMNELVEGIFNAEVQKNSEEFGAGVRVASGDLDGDGTASLLAELLVNKNADPLGAYSTIIQNTINSRVNSQGNTAGDLDLSFPVVNRVTAMGEDRESFMSITPAALSDAKKIKDAVLLGRKIGADPDKAIDDLRVSYNIPKPLMALLLPAVQKVRAYDGTPESADTPYLQWLESLDPMTSSGISHDAVAKYDAAGYLGALHVFVSNKYRCDNQDYASLLLLKARYQATLVMLFSDLWVE